MSQLPKSGPVGVVTKSPPVQEKYRRADPTDGEVHGFGVDGDFGDGDDVGASPFLRGLRRTTSGRDELTWWRGASHS